MEKSPEQFKPEKEETIMERKEKELKEIHENYLKLIDERKELLQQLEKVKTTLRNPDKKLRKSDLFFEHEGWKIRFNSLGELEKRLDDFGVKRFPGYKSKKEGIRHRLLDMAIETDLSKVEIAVHSDAFLEALEDNGWEVAWSEGGGFSRETPDFGMVRRLQKKEQ